MKLSELLALDVKNDFEIGTVTDDSRSVKAGDIFVFDKRITKGGEKFVEMAQEAGAAAIVTNLDITGENIYNMVNVGDVLVRYALHKFPKQPKNMVAVTGTNGKTSVAWFYHILAGKKAASIGTLGNYVNKVKVGETGFTSPTAIKLHQILNDFAKDKIDHVCLEASSHALDMHRIDGIKIQAAAFTNLSEDHRDYHGTMDNYMAAKARLFADILPQNGTAVLNINRPETLAIAAMCKLREVNVLTVGTHSAELVVKPSNLDAKGMDIEVKYKKHVLKEHVPLVGSFQAENIAAAIGLALSSGISFKDIEKNIKNITSVPGRMEIITTSNKKAPTVVVDYAHTPDALRTAISALRPQTKGKLWCVFGCGGDRDSAKRPMMGAIAESLSDIPVITDDNPRTENADNIRAEIASACKQGKNIAKRENAIEYAITNAAADDIVLLAGKGHESGQIIGKTVIPFDDREVAKEILERG